MTWDTSKPGDSDIVSNYPANERALRAFLESIFGVDHMSVIGGTQGFHKAVRMLNQSTPVAIAGGVIYPKVFEGTSELYYMDSDGRDIRMTYKGQLVVNLQETELIVNSLRTRTFFRGRVVDVPINSGQVEIDWESATLFRLNVTEDITVTLANMPDTTSEEEQTILLEVVNGGNHTIIVNSPYTILWKDNLVPSWTTDGKDLAIATSHDGDNILGAIVNNFGAGS